MSGCALRRWGPGTQCIKTDTPASREMAEKLAALKAEREKLNTIWTQPTLPSAEYPNKPANGSSQSGAAWRK
jgi:hypothetical protein